MLFRKIKDAQIRKEYKKKEILFTSLKFLYTNLLNQNKDKRKIEQFIEFKQKNFSKNKSCTSMYFNKSCKRVYTTL